MKASELRIGNFLNPKVNSVIINEDVHVVEPTTLMILQGVINGKGIYFEPIPLTEEWLLKLGFEENQGWDNMVYFNKNNIHIYKCNNSDKEWFEYECELLISSIHQLQNLYFALTNEELIIK